MDKLKNYNVSFSGLKLGEHTFEFEISQEFFDLFSFEQDFQKPEIDVHLNLEKHSTFLDLNFKIEGSVEVVCDITSENYRQPIHGEMPLVVKFGHEFDDSDDEVWIIPFGEYEINVAQMMYELALLSIPKKKVNPNLDSEQAQQALELLEKYAPKTVEQPSHEENTSIDPRWDSLKNLLNKK